MERSVIKFQGFTFLSFADCKRILMLTARKWLGITRKWLGAVAVYLLLLLLGLFTAAIINIAIVNIHIVVVSVIPIALNAISIIFRMLSSIDNNTANIICNASDIFSPPCYALSCRLASSSACWSFSCSMNNSAFPFLLSFRLLYKSIIFCSSSVLLCCPPLSFVNPAM